MSRLCSPAQQAFAQALMTPASGPATPEKEYSMINQYDAI